MSSGHREKGTLAILTGVAMFVICCAGYLVVTQLQSYGMPMSVSLGVAPPLVFVSTQQAHAIQACVIPNKMGVRTHVQLDGQDLIINPAGSVGDVQTVCAGNIIGVSPQEFVPGLHRLTFNALYSGRYKRHVGVPVAVGPFEERELWIPCAARIWIGQDFLDAPASSENDLAGAIERMLRQRRFAEPCLTGSVVDSAVHVSWIKSGLALSAMMRLDTGDVIQMAASLDLSSRDGRLHIYVPPSSLTTNLVGPSIFCQRRHYAANEPMIAHFFATDVAREINTQAQAQVRDRAARMIETELLGPVRALLEAPHPLRLGDSPEAQLDVRYGDLEIEPEQGALLCVDLRATTTSHAERIIPGPPLVPQKPLPPQHERSQTLRIDLSLRAMNAALDAAWRVGLLDRLLMKSSEKWADIFKDLTVLPTAMAFELPPVIQPGKAGPELTVGHLRVWLADREQPDQVSRIADLWARVDLSARFVQASKNVQLAAKLRDFGLSCQVGKAGEQRLEPCFSDAVQMLEDSLLNQPIATDAVGTIMVPVEEWLPGEADDKATLAVEVPQAELRPVAGGDWYQLFADVRVHDM